MLQKNRYYGRISTFSVLSVTHNIERKIDQIECLPNETIRLCSFQLCTVCIYRSVCLVLVESLLQIPSNYDCFSLWALITAGPPQWILSYQAIEHTDYLLHFIGFPGYTSVPTIQCALWVLNWPLWTSLFSHWSWVVSVLSCFFCFLSVQVNNLCFWLAISSKMQALFSVSPFC